MLIFINKLIIQFNIEVIYLKLCLENNIYLKLIGK